jgi:hypothetical protein
VGLSICIPSFSTPLADLLLTQQSDYQILLRKTKYYWQNLFVTPSVNGFCSSTATLLIIGRTENLIKRLLHD